MAVALDFTPPFEPGIFDFLAARAVAGVEEADSSSYARTVLLAGGHGWFRVTWDGSAPCGLSRTWKTRRRPELLPMVRHLFNLDHDPRPADAAWAPIPCSRSEWQPCPDPSARLRGPRQRS